MQFPGVLANDDVTLDIMPGEVFALVGENGAGKSTLMNILFGLNTPSAGTVTVKGEPIRSFSSVGAIARGIGMVHQHFMLVPSFTVAQNIVLGNEPMLPPFYNFSEANAIVRNLVEEYSLRVNPEDRVQDISVGLQQRVEILKALWRGADVLILDEPTAVLTPQETDELFAVIRKIVHEKGMTVIIITHKLYEVMAISDRVGVMRQGRLVGVERTKDVNERILASMMVGKDVLLQPLERKKQRIVGIRVEDLHVSDSRGLPAVRGLSFEVERGEILGIAGVEGNGQSELVEAITGLRRFSGGEITVNGTSIRHLSPGKIRRLGLAHVPEDRLSTGVAAKADIVDNLATGKQRKWPFSIAHVHLMKSGMKRYAKKLSEEYDIRGGGIWTKAGDLSGGNMQKVVLAREFSFNASVLVIAQPTRGVDIGAMETIHQQIMDRRNAGCAILLVSADLDELYRLSDRMITIYEGRITGVFRPDKADRTLVSQCMTGTATHLADENDDEDSSRSEEKKKKKKKKENPDRGENVKEEKGKKKKKKKKAEQQSDKRRKDGDS